MGAGQSKSLPQSSQPTTTTPSPPSNKVSPSLQQQESSGNGNSEAATGGGGCPMRNADGSYRTMPGFASLLGKFGGGSKQQHHPPITSSSTSTSPPTTSHETAAGSACPMKQSTTNKTKYDVYSRPIIVDNNMHTPLDPTNNMPSSSDTRNTLPASTQTSPLDTTRVSSTIPRGGGKEGETWTYPSPQMFYNALVRKGKLGNVSDADAAGSSNNSSSGESTTITTILAKEEDMASVVAMHNCMNEATWRRVLQWEEVLHPTTTTTSTTTTTTTDNNGNKQASVTSTDKSDVAAAVGPALSRFEGRPTDLSPKAYLKHYLLGHPLPFDRHDWTITRTNSDGSTTDVRYVIDYYHDDASASGEVGSGYPSLDGDVGPKGEVRSLLVDVRPAADGLNEVWGRLIGMPLARRGCASILECVLAGGGDCENNGVVKKSEFEPLPLFPSESLARGLDESKQVWKNIQQDALMKKGVGAMDDGDRLLRHSSSNTVEESSLAKTVELPKIDQSDATEFASTYSQILSTCHESKKALQNCQSEEECEQAMVGMTVCAGQYMCPLQHATLLDSLKLSSTNTAPTKEEEMASEDRISTALDILSECVANYDARASVAKKIYPELFDKVSKGQKQYKV